MARKVKSAGDGMLVSAADLWLGGLMIFAIVICAIAGALACTWIITSSSLFGDACKKAPLLQAWVALLAATGAVSWAGFAPSCSACWSSGRALSRRHAKWLAAAFAVIVTALVTWLILEPTTFETAVTWPLQGDHHARIVAVSTVIVVPPLFAVIAMWCTGVQTLELSYKTGLPISDAERYLVLRERLHNLLSYVGIVVSGSILATGMLRHAMLDGGFATAATYPEELVLAYGAFFTLLLVIAYVPAYLLVRHTGSKLVAKLANGDDVIAWQDERAKLAKLFRLEASLEDSLKSTIAILAPLVAGFASTALAK